MSGAVEVIGGKAYLSSTCTRCNGTTWRFDITNLDNATGSVSADGSTTCTCRTGKTYRLMLSIEIEAHDENERRSRPVAPVSEMPDWMC